VSFSRASFVMSRDLHSFLFMVIARVFCIVTSALAGTAAKDRLKGGKLPSVLKIDSISV